MRDFKPIRETSILNSGAVSRREMISNRGKRILMSLRDQPKLVKAYIQNTQVNNPHHRRGQSEMRAFGVRKQTDNSDIEVTSNGQQSGAFVIQPRNNVTSLGF